MFKLLEVSIELAIGRNVEFWWLRAQENLWQLETGKNRL